MNCPNCQTPAEAQQYTCHKCRLAYNDLDLLEWRQLEFLLSATKDWPGVENQRVTYVWQLAQIQSRLSQQSAEALVSRPCSEEDQLTSSSTAEPSLLPSLDVGHSASNLDTKPLSQPSPIEEPPLIAPETAGSNPLLKIPVPPPQKTKSVSFEQWLFSENTIKTCIPHIAGRVMIQLR